MERMGKTMTAAALALLWASAAWAATPAQKCQSAKNKAAGKYAACRANAYRALPLTSASDIESELSTTTAKRPGSTCCVRSTHVGLANAITNANKPAPRNPINHQVNRCSVRW